MDLSKLTIESFLEVLASDKPAPGGGSASALAGAVAASLVEMVANLTIGRKKYASVEKDMGEIRDKAVKLRKELTLLIDKDASAYKEVVETKFSQEAMIVAAEVPMKTASRSLEILKIAVTVLREGNKNAYSDAQCAVGLAKAAFNGAIANVRINLPYIKDGTENERVLKEVERLAVGFGIQMQTIQDR